MKKIIYRDKETKEIKSQTDYNSFGRAYGLNTEEVAKSVDEFNKADWDTTAEIIELDDVAEFYANRAEQAIAANRLYSQISENLEDMKERTETFAEYIEELLRKVKAIETEEKRTEEARRGDSIVEFT